MVRITANFVDVATGEVRRTVKVDGRIGDIFALQDKIVFELSQGLNLALRGTEIADIERQETRSVEAYESYARGMMNLRLATRDSIERAHRGVRGSDAATIPSTRWRGPRSAARTALKGIVPVASTRSRRKAIEMERRALAIDPELADAHMWLGAALLGLGQVDEAIARSARRSGSIRRTARRIRRLRRALWVGKGDFAGAIPAFERAIELNPEAGYSYLQLGLLLAWEGQLRRGRGDLPPRRRAAGAVHLRQRRPADRRRQRPARLRVLPAGPLRRGASASTSAGWRSSPRAITRCKERTQHRAGR